MNKYQQALDPIQVTPELRSRIIENVTLRVLSEKVRPVVSLRRYGALAACLAILLLGVLVVPKLTDSTTEPLVQDCNPMTEMESLEALEAAVGFPVKVPETLPFAPEETVYTYIDTGLAQIDYWAGDQSAMWRQALGSEDVSGDYNIYDIENTLTLDGQDVLLKGGANGFVLAIWSDGTYSYALSLSEPQSLDTWTEVLASIS